MGGRLPLHLDLTGRRVLVVGGGAVAARRVRTLVGAGAVVEVVAPVVSENLAGVPVARRRFVPTDVDDAWLVLACTGVVDDEVAAACEAARVWCVRADDATLSPAWLPAAARVDDVVVSVTAGRDPRRAVALRDALEVALSVGNLPLRRTRPGAGSVALVGGGPGDPDLLTVRGRRLLAGADVVVRDRLAPQVDLPAGVEVVEVGKGGPGTLRAQTDIDGLLVDRALAGARVVRLVAGSPSAVDTGQIAGCRQAGVPVEVVPGVASSSRPAGQP